MTYIDDFAELRRCRCGHDHARPGDVVTDKCHAPGCLCIHLVPQDGEPLGFEPAPERQ